ncbi:hypothetical protein [Paenibacillus sedimenti]|uniref:Uncharacterized protein n=1 Tax=Paenibacillus sedimenti TaxID=2770274 RepID=A0A926QIY9_9BACL|nr:hypothetical protein [Paenibacillus sedimenti]MBD0379842.1 hypothetical protein [Paenibacillus sedimenti]
MKTALRTDDMISIELTVKEALALGSGVKFTEDRMISAKAKRKVLQSLERKLLPATSKTIEYHTLEV